MDRNTQLALILAIVVVGGLGFVLGSNFGGGGAPSDGEPTVTPTTTAAPTTTQTPTTTVANGGTNQSSFGLIPLWQESYDGTCAGCHMAKGESSLHDPPFHPVGLSAEDNEHWFWDHNNQSGPNIALENPQVAGIQPQGTELYCTDCHAVRNPEGFENPALSNRSLDTHAVHENTVRREGCDRCHDRQANDSSWGVNSPIDMTRGFDKDFLADPAEATYGANGSEAGSGWARYGQAENPEIAQRSCGDCHGQYHLATMQFSFSPDTNVGPPIDADGGVGIKLQDTEVQCGACHTTNVHAVHTNGQMNTQGTGNLTNVLGAETCLECHGVSIAERNKGHYTAKGAIGLGLLGENDGEPDAVGYQVVGGDCGFCHENDAD